jgi:hypothetical protein
MNFNDKFCYEVQNSAIDIDKCIDYVNTEDWQSYLQFGEKYAGFHGIGLTAKEDSPTPELDSLMIYQDVSRHSGPKAETNWQQMTTPTRHVHGYIQQVFSRFKLVPHRARFAKIDPGKKISLHTDDYMENMTRVHWPIITNSKNYMLGYNSTTRKIDKYNFEVNKCYAINTNVVHGFINDSTESRIHLIVNFDVHFDQFKIYAENGLFTL